MVDVNPYDSYLYQPDISGAPETGVELPQPSTPDLPSNPLDDSNEQFGQQLALWTGGLSSLIANIVKGVTDLAETEAAVHPVDIAKRVTSLLVHVPKLLEPVKWIEDKLNGGVLDSGIHTAVRDANKSWGWIADLSIGTFYRGMLEVGLGVDTTQFDDEANRAVTTADTMMGFALMVPLICTAIGQAGKGMFGARWTEGWEELGKKLSEEMGLSWALGLQIDEAFKVAVGRAQEEAINRQKRGNRLEWPQLRMLFKQQGLPEDVLIDLLKNAGFPDEQITYLLKLKDVQLQIGDISQLWYREDIDDDRAKHLIKSLGFDDTEVDMLFNLYMQKSENTASAKYFSIAEQMFTEHILTEQQFRGIMQKARYPKKMVDQTITAIKLEQQLGTVIQSVSVTKSLYQHSQIDGKEAQIRLQLLNYSPEYATDLIQTWTLPPIKHQHGLSQSKVLSYYVSGVLKRHAAETMLMSLGLDGKSIRLLLDHPTIAPGVRQHARTPGLVVTAFVDGAITGEALPAALKSAGVQDADIPLYVSQATWRMSQRKGSPAPHQIPVTSDVEAAQKAGLIDFQHAVTLYEQLGWSSDWATMKAEIINKGPYQPPTPPLFATIGEAESYMIANGYKILPPIDPRIMAAEQMLALNGLMWEKQPSDSGGEHGGSGGEGGGSTGPPFPEPPPPIGPPIVPQPPVEPPFPPVLPPPNPIG